MDSLKNSDLVAKEIAGYVARGLRVVLLHGVARPGVCRCSKGADCPSPGKQPIGKTWQHTASEDDVFAWWSGDARHNVGVMLGPTHRGNGDAVIDVECDGAEAEAELRRLGLDRVETPTWSSGRGLHRLFLWTPELPDVAVVKPHGVEVRIGGGGKMAQSVLPPSTHHTGRQYQWVPGYGLEDVPIAPLPAVLIEAVRNCKATATATPDRRSVSVLRAAVAEGGRNDAMFAAAMLLARAVHPGDDEQEAALLEVLHGVNAARCRPRLDDGEVASIFRSAVKYRREAIATDAIMPGVEAMIDGWRTVYKPAGLELTIHRGDPSTFELRNGGLPPVRVEADAWGDPRKMLAALFSAWPGVPLDRWPGDFATIWRGAGEDRRRRIPATPGLRLLLEQEAVAAGRVVEVTDPAEHNTRRLVGLLVAYLERVAERGPVLCETRGEEPPTDAEAILEHSQAHRGAGWVAGRLWFHWERAWRQIATQYGLERGAPTRVARAMPAIVGRRLEPQRVEWRGQRETLRSLSMQEWERLRDYGGGA